MFVKIVRLGKDSQVRYTQNGKAVLSFSGAYDVGWGEKKRPQWISVSYWGKNAEGLSAYLKKGVRVQVECGELYVEEYNGKTYLKGTASNLQLIDKASEVDENESPDRTQGSTEVLQKEFDDDIPF